MSQEAWAQICQIIGLIGFGVFFYSVGHINGSKAAKRELERAASDEESRGDGTPISETAHTALVRWARNIKW